MLAQMILQQPAIMGVMAFPSTMRWLRLLAFAAGIYGIIWIASEGQLYRAIFMAVFVTALTTASLIQRYLSGRIFTVRRWIFILAALGMFIGVSVGLLTLVFMAVKTGLHGHGPEFTQDQASWVLRQVPLWGAVGLVGGLGLGMVTARKPKAH